MAASVWSACAMASSVIASSDSIWGLYCPADEGSDVDERGVWLADVSAETGRTALRRYSFLCVF